MTRLLRSWRLFVGGIWGAGVCISLTYGCGEGDKTGEAAHADDAQTAGPFPSASTAPTPDASVIPMVLVGVTPPIPFVIPPACAHPGFPGGDQHFDFEQLRETLLDAKPAVESRQAVLLTQRYDLSDQPSPSIAMTRGKPIQVGVRVKLPEGQTWESLANMTPEQIQQEQLFPAGFYPLPHPNHQLGGFFSHTS